MELRCSMTANVVFNLPKYNFTKKKKRRKNERNRRINIGTFYEEKKSPDIYFCISYRRLWQNESSICSICRLDAIPVFYIYVTAKARSSASSRIGRPNRTLAGACGQCPMYWKLIAYMRLWPATSRSARNSLANVRCAEATLFGKGRGIHESSF